MKLDMKKTFKAINGQTIKMEKTNENMTLKDVCMLTLLGNYPDEKITGEDKYQRYKLTKRIESKDVVELDVKEITLLKDLIGKAYNTIIVGQAYDMLEGKDGDRSND